MRRGSASGWIGCKAARAGFVCPVLWSNATTRWCRSSSGGPSSCRRQIAHLEGEQPVRRDRAEDAGDPILLGLVEAQLHPDRGPGMPVDGQMGAAELPLVGQVGEHAEVGAGIRRVDQAEAVAALRVGLQCELCLAPALGRSRAHRRTRRPRLSRPK